MALVYPVTALAGLWVLGGYAHNLKRSVSNRKAFEAPEDPIPFNAPYSHIKYYGLTSDDRFFRSVEEDHDAQGAKIFWVDYGNGQRVQQYFDPRIIV